MVALCQGQQLRERQLTSLQAGPERLQLSVSLAGRIQGGLALFA